MPHRTTYTSDRLCEWLFVIMVIAWGCWLLVPEWQPFSGPQYAVPCEIAGEPVWGVWSIAIGVIRCSALYINGSHYRTPAVRAACAGLGVIWWLVLGLLFLNTPMPNPAAGFAWYSLFVLFEGMCVYRSARDGGIPEHFRRGGPVSHDIRGCGGCHRGACGRRWHHIHRSRVSRL